MKVLNPLKEAEIKEIIGEIKLILDNYNNEEHHRSSIITKIHKFHEKYNETKDFVITTDIQGNNIIEFK